MDEIKTAGNVSKIDEARKKKNIKDKEKPLQRAELYLALTDAINRESFSTLPKFPQRFVIYSASSSMRVIGELEDGDIVKIHDNDLPLDTAIMAYCNQQLCGREDFRWTAKSVREARDFWVMASTPLPDVKPYRWLSEPGYTFNRLPWNFTEAETAVATPTWDGLLRRVTNASALRKWIGSLFVEGSDTHQYVWMFGLGGDGKGAINRFLARVFGGAYCAKQPPKAGGERFWTFGLIGKRLVSFPDCNDAKFVASGLFKSLTGGDPVDMEAKLKMSFTYKPCAKYLFFSNEKPLISSEKADTRRIIYCVFDRQDDQMKIDPDFEELLWSEGGDFLNNCIYEYKASNPRHGAIECGDGELKEHLSVVEERFEVIYEQHFCKPIPEYCSVSGLNETKDWVKVQEVAVVPKRMQVLLSHYFKSNQAAGEFVKWLEVKHGVKKSTLRFTDGRGRAIEPKVYVGIAERSDQKPLDRLADGLTDGRRTDERTHVIF